MKKTILFLMLAVCFMQYALPALSDLTLKSYLLGQFEPKDDRLFVAVPDNYSGKDYTQYLRQEAMDAFKKMADAAKKDGITLIIVSATRNFYAQKNIWEAKWNGTNAEWNDVYTKYPVAVERAKAILQYSAMPGTSRHHWGTDMDINSVEPEYFSAPQGKKEYEWLVKNAPLYGFSQPYTSKGESRPYGFEEEQWHWSYMPLAREFLRKYPSIISYNDITGFDGSETAKQLKVVDNYVFGIDSNCK